MIPKQFTVRIALSLIFAATFGIGMSFNATSIPGALWGALGLWCVGVSAGFAILAGVRKLQPAASAGIDTRCINNQ